MKPESFQAAGGPFRKVVSDTGLIFSSLLLSSPLPSPFSFLYFPPLPSTPQQKSGDRTHTILFSLSDPEGSKGQRAPGAGLQNNFVCWLISSLSNAGSSFLSYRDCDFFLVLICHQQVTSDPNFICIFFSPRGQSETNPHTVGDEYRIWIYLFTSSVRFLPHMTFRLNSEVWTQNYIIFQIKQWGKTFMPPWKREFS